MFNYIYNYENEPTKQVAFYQLPKFLFTDKMFKDISIEAKTLYTVMLDRMSLSIKNNWVDMESRVYIIFKIKEICEFLGCGREKAGKLLAELDTNKGIGLIERKRRGLGKPDLIYVKKAVSDDKDSNIPNNREQESKNKDIKSQEPPKQDTNNQIEQFQEAQKSDTINTNINNTNINNTDNINTNVSGISSQVMSNNKEKVEIQEIESLIKEQINYSDLITVNEHQRSFVDEIVFNIFEIYTSIQKTIRIGTSDKPKEVVLSIISKLKYNHIQHVIDKFTSVTNKITNHKAYLRTMLYNTVLEKSLYYINTVNVYQAST